MSDVIHIDGQAAMTFGDTTAEQFEQFHAENPRVYRVLVQIAREWRKRTGRTRLGIGALYERARWEIAITTSDPSFKLNNDYRAFYARLIMARETDLAGMFNLRTSEADKWIAGRTA